MANTIDYYYDVIQTFYVDASIAGGSTKVELASIDLYFKSKPLADKQLGGVQVWLCQVNNSQPDPSDIVPGSVAMLPYAAVSALGDASRPSTFQFPSLVQVDTNKFYGIVISFADVTNGYDLWVNKTGDGVLGQNILSPGPSTIHNVGKYFKGHHSKFVAGSTNLTPISDTHLKFNVNFAHYTANTISTYVVNKEYEFFTATRTSTTPYVAGELVYQVQANSTGTVNVTSACNVVRGTSTTFDSRYVGKHVALWNGSTSPAQFDLFGVQSVTNSTNMTLTSAPNFSNTVANYFFTPAGKHSYSSYLDNLIVLVDSTATNSSFRFATGRTIVGNDSNVQAVIGSIDNVQNHRFKPLFKINAEPKDTISTSYSYSSSAYSMSSFTPFTSGTEVDIRDATAIIASRSNEVAQTTLYGTNKKSSVANVTIKVNQSTDNLYHSPAIIYNELDIEVYRKSISNSTSQVVGGYDTEVQPGSGLAVSKYISNRVNFANNTFSEDAVCYLTAWRPPGTDIKVYCKLRNSTDPDSFDSKSWTPMTASINGTKYSSSVDPNDLIEYTYTIPAYGAASSTVSSGSKQVNFTTQPANSVIAGDGTISVNSVVITNSVVRIYNPAKPDEVYQVSAVIASNTTTFTIGDNGGISNNSMVGSNFYVDIMQYPYIATHDVLNQNIVQYFNSSLAAFQTFDQMQLKIVLQADDSKICPEVDQYQFIGVSA